MDTMNTEAKQTEAGMVHAFERAGLGKAPFRYIGMEAQDLCYGQAILNRAEYERTGIAITTKPGGTCAYCGTYILNMYRVSSVDGRTFHVGSDCILKTGDKGLSVRVTEDKRKADKVKRDARQAKKAAELAQWNSENCAAELAILDRLSEVPGFPGSFASDVAKRLRRGECRGLSERQTALLNRLVEENDIA